jgi:hypothetical protein
MPAKTAPDVSIRPEGDWYLVTTDFGDVATFHRFATKVQAERFAAGRGRSIVVIRPSKSSVISRNANMKRAAQAASVAR